MTSGSSSSFLERSHRGLRPFRVHAVIARASLPMKTPEAAPHPPKEPSAVSTDDGTPLPDGWQRFPSRSRPGESAYRNMLTGERRRHPPTEPAAVSTDDGPPLPDGWKRFASRSRPGETVYRNMITGQRVRHRPAQPASAAYEPPGPIITKASITNTIATATPTPLPEPPSSLPSPPRSLSLTRSLAHPLT